MNVIIVIVEVLRPTVHVVVVVVAVAVVVVLQADGVGGRWVKCDFWGTKRSAPSARQSTKLSLSR